MSVTQMSAAEIAALPKNLPQARALVAERDRLRETAKAFLEAIGRAGSSVPAQEYFDLAEALDAHQ